MANITNTNPMILDTPGTTNLGQSYPMQLSKIVWEGTTIVAGDQLVITDGAGSSTLFEHTASNFDVSAGTSNQSIPLDTGDLNRILPTLAAGGWRLSTMTHGKVYLYF